MARSRSRTSFSSTGSYVIKRYNLSGGLTGTESAVPVTIQSMSENCVDHVSPHPYYDGPLTLSRKVLYPPRLDGHFNIVKLGSRYDGTFSGYAGANLRNIANISSMPSPSTAYWHNKALANMNPNGSKVDFPDFLYEFRDFPTMLRDLGRVLLGKIKPSDIPNGYVAYRFGWKPLFGDLYSLLNLADSIARRKQDLLKSWNGDGRTLSRRLGGTSYRVPFGGTYNPFNVTSAFMGVLLSATWYCTYYENAWYTSRIKLLDNPFLLSPKDLDSAIFRSLLGIDKPLSTLWEILPWSWLIDYFAGVGDMLSANAGRFRYSVEAYNLMVKQEIFLDLEVTDGPNYNLTLNPGHSYSKQLNRSQPLPFVSPIAFLGALSHSQIAILDSLIIAKVLQGLHL